MLDQTIHLRGTFGRNKFDDSPKDELSYVSSHFLDALNMRAEFYADTYYGNSDAKTEQHECWSQLINCQGLINPNFWVVFMRWGNELFVSCLGPPELIREAFMSQPRLV